MYSALVLGLPYARHAHLTHMHNYGDDIYSKKNYGDDMPQKHILRFLNK
jgi:hypothetical protein